jgi:glycosyltransferase involved in cell wall biosynthesis
MKISIITVVRNNEATIKETIDSVLSQTHKDIEYIVVDGASTDGTVEIVSSYGNKINKFISEQDMGLYDAINKGIDLATGDVVGILHSDDLYLDPEVLSKVSSEFVNNSSLDACYSDMVYVDRHNSSRIVRYWKTSKFIPGSFAKGWSPPHPTFFVNRKIYEKLGSYNLKYSIASDTELMMRLLEVHKINVTYIPQLWVKMRMGGISTDIRNLLKQNKEVLTALETHNLSKNIFIFFVSKIISRIKQLIQRPI